MEAFDEYQTAIVDLFHHEMWLEQQRIERESVCFVHYTSAEVAMSIIQNECIWMRNAITMNDYSEIQYGTACLLKVYNDGGAGARLTSFLDSRFPGCSDRFESEFNSRKGMWQYETYLTSFSEHLPSENDYGRLSMWRAYGGHNGVALVLNNTPFTAVSDNLKAYSGPVSYQTEEEFGRSFNNFVDRLIAHRELLETLSEEYIISNLIFSLRSKMLMTKHPGFREEREWRIVYAPTYEESPAIQPSFTSIDGIPQQIYKIPLRHDPAAGLHHADIPSVLNRLIIGPSRQPVTLYNSFSTLLTNKGVSNVREKIALSSIPLRM